MTTTGTGHRLDRVFNARNVAIVGDSARRNYMWTKNNMKVTGKLYGVHIDEKATKDLQDMGVPVYRSLLDIPDEIDYVVVSVPRNIAPQVVRDCVAKGVGGCVLFTAGFAETGEEEGIHLGREITEIARQGNLPLIGPNCMGLYLPHTGVRHSLDQPVGPEYVGSLGVVSQSGTHATNLSQVAQALGIGVSKSVSIGNAFVLDEGDYLEYFAQDPQTEVIVMYLEGVRDGRRFFRILRETTSRKPVIIWKGGQSEAGFRAVYSHTASLGVPAVIWSAAMRQAGAIAVGGLEEAMDTMKVLTGAKPFTKKAEALVTLSGGQSVSMTDAFSAAGIDVPRMSDASYAELREFFKTTGGSYQNPFDAGYTIGLGGEPGNLGRLLDIINADENIGMLAFELAIGFQGKRWLEAPKQLEDLLGALRDFRDRTDKPVVTIAAPLHVEDVALKIRARVDEYGLPWFASYERAASALSRAGDYYRFRAGMD